MSRSVAALLALMAVLLPLRPASAQQALSSGALTLSSAIEEALLHRPLLAADTDRVGAARARVSQARAGFLPRVDIQASATDGPLGAPAMGLGGLVGTPIKKHTGGSLNVIQTLLDFGRTQNTVRSRRAEVAASQEALAADRSRVVLEVQQAYFQALEAGRLLGVNQQLLEQRRLVAKQAAALMQNNLASRVDVDLAEVSVSQAQLGLVRARSDVETARAALSTAIGRSIPATTSLEDSPLGTPAEVPPLQEATSSALRDRPELRQVAAQARVYDHLASAARAGKRPLLVGVGSVGKVNPVPLFESSDKPWAVGLALTIPIFTGGAVEGQVEEAIRNAGAARAGAEELANAIRQQVAAALASLAAGEESVRVAEAQRKTAQDALSLATQRYQLQLGSIVELSQAQLASATAEYDLVHAQYDRERARAALAFATGRRYGFEAAGTPR